MKPAPSPTLITPALLRRYPLPRPGEEGDKNERGLVLVVGGAPEMPGAAILAAIAALRAGAGKARIATCASVAPLVAVTVPEARVFGLPETDSGAIAEPAAAKIIEAAGQVQALLIGPGLVDADAVVRLLRGVLPHLERPTLVLDAAALASLSADPHCVRPLHGNVILTPHATEMALMLGVDKDAVTRDPPGTALRTAAEYCAVVVLKGPETFIATPEGALYCNKAGNVGLATAGSGDTLAGVIAGLAARGADPARAALWGVSLHARAGDALARRTGPLGFLAHELLAEIPALMHALGKEKR